MAIEQWKIGQVAQELMAQLENDGADGEITVVLLAVEITGNDSTSRVVFRSNDPRIHIQLGLMDVVSEIARRQIAT